MERVLGLRVEALDVAHMPLRDQLTHVRRSAVGLTPDGGASFVLAFLPAGGSLVVLGWLERWLWANDGRLRAFYCQPRRRDSKLPCPQVDGDGGAPSAADCYALSAVQSCIETMLSCATTRETLVAGPGLSAPATAATTATPPPLTSAMDKPASRSSVRPRARRSRSRPAEVRLNEVDAAAVAVADDDDDLIVTEEFADRR